jgi:hypothetical protein
LLSHFNRDILRTAKHFYWCNDDGEQWSVILKESARKEFETARSERDPLIVARLLVVGQQALMEAQYKVDSLKGDMTRKVNPPSYPTIRASRPCLDFRVRQNMHIPIHKYTS